MNAILSQFQKKVFQHHRKECGQNNNYECGECAMKFRFANAFTKHANLVHNNKEPFACSQCTSFHSNISNLSKHMKIHDKKSNENDIQLIHHLQDQQVDDNNNNSISEQPANTSSSTVNNSQSIPDNSIQNICVTCKSKLKLKKLWSRTVIDQKYSFIVNDVICELASRHWKINLNTDGKTKICFNCKMYLISGRKNMVTENKRGRLTLRKGGFINVCNKCHSEVSKT